MSADQKPLRTVDVLRLHEELETKYGDGDGGNFLFGWQPINPFAGPTLAAVKRRAKGTDYTKYAYLETNEEIAEAVLALHRRLDGYDPEAAFCAASGGTAILFSFAYWLARLDVKEVYYVPPIYFTLLNGLRQFGVRARAISHYHPFEQEFALTLPSKHTVLVIADPTWYAGLPVPKNIIKGLADWQARTGSTIFVDGSFQYMRWDEQVSEPTAMLDPSKTIRLVSPTKSLVIHGYRFAYALLPKAIKPKFSTSYTNICGPASADSIAFAHEAVAAMSDRKLITKLIRRASKRHRDLRKRGIIASPLQPRAGYFVFEKLNIPVADDRLKMTGEYFGQPRFGGHARINLLSSRFHLLDSK
jgi:aspartate/methionine/tyrosine aminotransferase